MKRIQELRLKNFKAFHDQPFKFDGKHALIYGNNGSGKSSIFWALYTFLQSTGKTKEEITKYFVPLRDGIEETYQSLRHVFADIDAEAFIELTWADEPPTTRTTQLIGLEAAGGQNTTTGLPLSELERTRFDPSTGTDATIKEANLGSDFIHYRFLQDFYQRSNRDGVNLWPVFMRDLFPFYPTTLFTDQQGQPQRLEMMLRELLHEAHSRVRWDRIPKQDFESRITIANQAISLFANTIRNNANQFLRDNFLNGEETLQIDLEYDGQLYFDLLRDASETAVDREWRQNINEELSIVLSVRVKRNDQAEIHHYRPQSFLNEAQLTRIALAVRLGALLTRVQRSDLKLLCLDDLLISLDMSNRRHVLDWLFNPSIMQQYQIIFLTHDFELQRMVGHYIDTRSKRNEWRFFELFMNERHGTSPYVPPSISNDFVAQAKDSFNRLDFRSSGTFLRRYLEGRLRTFIPDSQRFFQNKDRIEAKELTAMVQALKPIYRLCTSTYITCPLRDLELYVSLHLNPLSHDHPITAIYQDELSRFIYEVVPALELLNRNEEIAIDNNQPTRIEMRLTDRTGGQHIYRYRLLEPLFYYTIPVFDATGSLKPFGSYSDPLCELEGTQIPGGTGFIMRSEGQLEPLRLRTRFRALCGPLRIVQPELRTVLHKL